MEEDLAGIVVGQIFDLALEQGPLSLHMAQSCSIAWLHARTIVARLLATPFMALRVSTISGACSAIQGQS